MILPHLNVILRVERCPRTRARTCVRVPSRHTVRRSTCERDPGFNNSHSYTHLILALGIVREPTIWVFITSKYPGTHDIGLPIVSVIRG